MIEVYNSIIFGFLMWLKYKRYLLKTLGLFLTDLAKLKTSVTKSNAQQYTDVDIWLLGTLSEYQTKALKLKQRPSSFTALAYILVFYIQIILLFE